MTGGKIGVVVIGRNEGDRLKASLETLGDAPFVVYVDSGSHDGSLEYALSKGVEAISLDLDKPFTAARARNMGIRHLLSLHPDMEFIQTVDGDCTIDGGWLASGGEALQAHPSVSTVFGRLRERNPNLSVYNNICDDEWNTPLGEAESCGGIAMHRVAPFMAAGGFSEDLIAGEEPDLCLRLRDAGWSILRIDAEMGEHDAAMTRFGQWWRRSVRAGHAYAEHLWRHGRDSLASWKKQAARFLFWGALLPFAVATLLVLLAAFSRPSFWPLVLLLAYPLQFIRLWLRDRRRRPFSGRRAFLAVIGKFSEALGAVKFARTLLLRRQAKIIEHK